MFIKQPFIPHLIKLLSLAKLSFPFTNKIKKHLVPQHQFQLYFKGFDEGSINVFDKLNNKTYFPQQIIKITDDYFHSQLYKKYPNTMIGLLYLCKDLTNSRQISRRILQYLIRIENVQVFQCTSATFLILMTEIKKFIDSAHQKIKESNIRYIAAQIIKNNRQIIDYTHLQSIINIITNNDRNLVSHKIRFLEIANILHPKIKQFLELFIKKTNSYHHYEVLNKSIYIILHFYQDFPPQSNQQTEVFYSFLLYKYFSDQVKHINNGILYKMYKSFPSNMKTFNGKYYKDLLFEKIVQYKKQNKIKAGQNWNQPIFWYSMLTFQFYKFMKERQYKYDGDLNYLIAEDIHPPQLHNYAWEHYQIHYATINKDRIMQNIIAKVYPEQFISIKQKIEPRRHEHTFSIQNEIKTRVSIALKNLGYKHSKQIEVNSRFADFLIEDNIIIQCDGDHHFNLHIMQYNQNSQFRNLHFLLTGYRLVIIHIYEYNKFRTIQQLQNLIQSKMQCLKKHNAVFVI